MTSCLRLAALLILCIGSAWPLQAQEGRSSAPAPVLRVVERTADGVIYEVRADWSVSFAEALRSSDPLGALALRAVRGDGVVSKALDLPSLAAPTVEVLASDFDEVAYVAAAGDSSAAYFAGPVAEVVGVGTERRVPRGTFVARLLHYDAERGTARRYRRLVVAVRFAAGRDAGAAARFGPSDNPHLAVEQSVLASGTWFKVPVTEEGIYRIDRAYLQSLGLSPDGIDPNEVAVFGNGGMPVPALNSADRIADLAENATLVVGGGDGSFGQGDAVYFYGAAPSAWRWDTTEAALGRPGWRHAINLFSSVNYYFVRIGGVGAQRIGSPDFANLPDAQ